MQKADLFGAFKIPLALCAAGLAVIGMSNVSGTLIVGIMPTILLPYQALAIALIGLLLLVLLDRLFLGVSRLRDWHSHHELKRQQRKFKSRSPQIKTPHGQRAHLRKDRSKTERATDTKHGMVTLN